MTGDWITSKPLEALMGIFSSSMAIASACGFLFALGIPFISQVYIKRLFFLFNNTKVK